MPHYAMPDKEHYDAMKVAIKKWHPHLNDAGVQIQIVMAYANRDDTGEISGPAIKVHGYAALASITVLKLKDRLLRDHDVEISIDGDQWPAWHSKTRLAILDHELTHLELERFENSNDVKLDDLGRPRLKLKKHDFQVGWFHAVAERHGEFSVEIKQFRQLVEPLEQRQLYLPFVPDEAID